MKKSYEIHTPSFLEIIFINGLLKFEFNREHALIDHIGWSMSSKMSDIYIHYFGNESSKSLLEAYGIEY